MKLIGSIKKPRWYDIPCSCIKGNIEKSYPFTDCKNCKFKRAENSLPKKDFKVGKRLITEVTIHRGSLDDVIGWSY